MKRLAVFVAALSIQAAPAGAINFVFDYTYAGGTFLDDPAVQALLDTAAGQYTPFTDHLSRIDEADFAPGNVWSARIQDPSSGTYPTDIPDLIVPADTLVIYVGAMDLGGSAAGFAAPGGWTIAYSDSSWLDTVSFRGQTGQPSNTDFGPWGGYISFDSTLNWNLSAGLPAFDQVDFLSLAVHELGHIMGFGPAGSWKAQINASNEFTGPEAVSVYGSNVPLEAGGGHWADNLPGVPEPAMDPTISTGQRKLLTTLDYAGFADIGWQVPAALLPEPDTGLLVAAGLLLLAGLSATRRDARRHRASGRLRRPPSRARPREPRRSRGWAQARG